MTQPRQKELAYDPTTNRHFLYDESGQIHPCDIYGRKKTKFHINLTGIASYKDRLQSGQISPLSHVIDNSIYHPQPLHFEGYFQFPRPLSHPFINLISSNPESSALLKQLSTSHRFNLPKNKSLLSLKPNSGLHYLSSSISLRSPSSKIPFINLINSTIKSNRKNNMKNYSSTNRSLRNIRHQLLNNADNKIHGRTLSKPTMKAQEEFYIMNKVYNVLPLQKKSSNNDKEKCRNASMDYILMSRNGRYEDDKLCFISSVGNEDDFGKERVTYVKRTMGEEERIKEEMMNRPKEKIKGVYIKYDKPKMPTRGDMFRRDLGLMRKVNPIAIEKEEEKNRKDRMFFEKKRKFKVMQNRKYIVKGKRGNNSVG